MEKSYEDEGRTTIVVKTPFNDDSNLISLASEINQNGDIDRPRSCPSIMDLGPSVAEAGDSKSNLNLSSDVGVNVYEDFLDGKEDRSHLHESVIHLLTSGDLQVQSSDSNPSSSKDDGKHSSLEQKCLSSMIPLSMGTSQRGSDEGKGVSEDGNPNEDVMSLNNIRKQTTYFNFSTLVNNTANAPNSETSAEEMKKSGSGKKKSKPKSKSRKIQTTGHLLPKVNQDKHFLNGATMILDQQGQTITEIQSTNQLNGIYTMQISNAEPGLQSAISQTPSAQQPLAFETIPAPSSSLRSSSASAIDPVNQQWFTTKDDKSFMQVKGVKWKQGMWSKEEVALLKDNIDKYCKMHNVDEPSQLIFYTSKDQRKHFYRSIAKGICRPLFAIYRKTLRLYDFRNYIGKYSDEDVAKLERLHEKYGHDWATIGHCMGRSSASVKDRCRLLRKNKKTGRWTEEEENILSQCVREQTNTKEGESVTSGVTWSIVADRLGTRTEKQCRAKWLNYLNWKEVGGKEWTKNDEIELIERVSSFNVEDEMDLDWVKLADQWLSARSPQWLRGKWWAIKKHVPDYKHLNFHEIMQYLQTTYLDALRLKIDRQTVALASTFSVNPAPLPLHSSEHLASHVTVDNLPTSDSSAVIDTSGLSNSQSHSIMNTSTIDLASLQGYQLQFQLASLSPHQLLIPVNSTNITDHFVIPVNMASAIITSAADQQTGQTGYIVHNVVPVTEHNDGLNSSRDVELTQALVQTDLSIPIPTGDLTQESLSAANMEAINSNIVASLGHSLGSPTATKTSPDHHFADSMTLLPSDVHGGTQIIKLKEEE